MKKRAFQTALVLVSVIIAGVFCSSGKSGDGIPEIIEGRHVVRAYEIISEMNDDYDAFVALKDQWANRVMPTPQIDDLRKKLVTYIDCRIGVINGASSMAAKKADYEFNAAREKIEKEHGAKF